MSSNQILFGLGLVLVLAVGSQLFARLVRVPALVVLLPAGFLAGVATDDVHPDRLLGSLYQPFVSIAVGVILFEAGLRLSFEEVGPGVRKAVVRLVTVGVLLTWLATTATVMLLYGDMDHSVAFLIGAILVVSGPTVVLPLLAFIRPARNVRSLLKWEGTLVDPIGALLGVLVFVGVSSGKGWQPGAMLIDVGVGALVAAVGAAALWLLLREVHRSAPRMVVPATLMVVVAAVVAADLIREDAGLMAAVLMGIVVANQRGIDISLSLYEFEETLVQLLIGVLFVLVAASVSPMTGGSSPGWRRGASSPGQRRPRSAPSWRRKGSPGRAWSFPSCSWRSSARSWSTGSAPLRSPGCSGWPEQVADWCSSSAAIRGRARSGQR
jgi:NhaP-type Na+/H+ or K+/H+ antiporter